MTVARDAFFIGNQWAKPASDRRFTLVNASSGDVLGTVPEGVEADIDAAVAAARRALTAPGWADIGPAARAEIMERFMGALASRGEAIAQAVSAQNGMPIALSSLLEGQFGAGIVQYYAALAQGLGAPDVRPSQMGKETLVEHGPIGVVAAIVPWNFPVTLALNKIAPALATGCTMVIKPSPGTTVRPATTAPAFSPPRAAMARWSTRWRLSPRRW